MRQLAMADAAFVLSDQPNISSNHIGLVFVFDPSPAAEPVTFEKLLTLYSQRLPLAAAFRERIVRVPLDLDYPYWINDKQFDLDFHVRHTGLPRPGTRKQFFAVANRIMSIPMDMSRPLWETHLIEGIDAAEGIPPGSFALLCKMHHAAVDGVSGMEMISALLESDEAAAAHMPKAKWRGEEPPDPKMLLLKALGSSWSGPFRVASALIRAMPSITSNRQLKLSGEAIKPPKNKVPKIRFNGAVTAHRVMEGRSWSFAEVKRLKDMVPGTTINDLILAVLGGSLRRYLEDKGELPKESLVAAVSISVRSKQQMGTGGNQVSAAFVSLHTQVADPLKRLAATREAMRQVKDYNNAIDAKSLAQVTEAMPGALMGLGMRALMTLPPNDSFRFMNTTVSNVPGPLGPKTLLGARFVAGFGSGPLTNGNGLFHVVTSMSGVLSIGFSVCREHMPDPEFYAQCIEDSFNELRDAIDARGAAGELPAPAKASARPKRNPRNAATPPKPAGRQRS